MPSSSYTYINNYVTINKNGKLENLDNQIGKHELADGCDQAIGSFYDISFVEYIEPLIKFMKNK